METKRKPGKGKNGELRIRKKEREKKGIEKDGRALESWERNERTHALLHNLFNFFILGDSQPLFRAGESQSRKRGNKKKDDRKGALRIMAGLQQGHIVYIIIYMMM